MVQFCGLTYEWKLRCYLYLLELRCATWFKSIIFILSKTIMFWSIFGWNFALSIGILNIWFSKLKDWYLIISNLLLLNWNIISSYKVLSSINWLLIDYYDHLTYFYKFWYFWKNMTKYSYVRWQQYNIHMENKYLVITNIQFTNPLFLMIYLLSKLGLGLNS